MAKMKQREFLKMESDVASRNAQVSHPSGGQRVQVEVRACLHGGGGPQVGEVTRLGGVTRLSI